MLVFSLLAYDDDVVLLQFLVVSVCGVILFACVFGR